MKYFNILFFVIFLSIGSSAIAQPLKPSANTTTSSYKSSIPGWYVNVQKANVESAKTGKPILANFTGSDWCGWCMKLRREVFDTPEFQEWAKKNVVLLELDYPRKKVVPEDIKKQNADLQRAFSIQGYPTLWIFTLSNTDQGQVTINPYGKLSYIPGGPQAWIKKADEVLANKKK